MKNVRYTRFILRVRRAVRRALVAVVSAVALAAAPAADNSAPLLVQDWSHQGQESLEIRTPHATWIYHKEGAGFASLKDANGFEWIGYRPDFGPAGEHRGIPNLVFRRGGSAGRFFHPGFSAAQGSVTEIVARSHEQLLLHSSARTGKWKTRWEIFTDYARLTVLENDPDDPAFWFLYEGTPGGRLDATDYCLRSSGDRVPLDISWEDTADRARWVAFVCPSLGRSLVLAAPDLPGTIPVSYWPMRESMTVFGFGRKLHSTESFLHKVPTIFIVALVDIIEPGALRSRAEELLDRADGEN